MPSSFLIADFCLIRDQRGAELISVACARPGILWLTEACPELVRGRGTPTLAKAKGGGSPTKGRRKRPPGKVASYYFSDPKLPSLR